MSGNAFSSSFCWYWILDLTDEAALKTPTTFRGHHWVHLRRLHLFGHSNQLPGTAENRISRKFSTHFHFRHPYFFTLDFSDLPIELIWCTSPILTEFCSGIWACISNSSSPTLTFECTRSYFQLVLRDFWPISLFQNTSEKFLSMKYEGMMKKFHAKKFHEK